MKNDHVKNAVKKANRETATVIALVLAVFLTFVISLIL